MFVFTSGSEEGIFARVLYNMHGRRYTTAAGNMWEVSHVTMLHKGKTKRKDQIDNAALYLCYACLSFDTHIISSFSQPYAELLVQLIFANIAGRLWSFAMCDLVSAGV